MSDKNRLNLIVTTMMLLWAAPAFAQIDGNTTWKVDLTNVNEAHKKTSWSGPDVIAVTQAGLGWGNHGEDGTRSFWLQSEPIGIGLSWRPATRTSIKGTLMHTATVGSLYARYSVDGKHWTTWQYLTSAGGGRSTSFPTHVFEGTLRVPDRKAAQYRNLVSKYSARNDVAWRCDEEALVTEIVKRDPKFFETTKPFIGYVQFLYEGQLHGGQRLKRLELEMRCMVGGWQIPPKDEATSKGRNVPWRFKVPKVDADMSSLEAEMQIRKLGSPVFADRQAAEKALRSMGARAAAAVQKAMKSSDLETVRRCQALWPHLWQTEIARPDAERMVGYDHPLWTRFRKIAGDDAASRTLFAEMVVDLRGFIQLETVEADPAKAAKAYEAELKLRVGRMKQAYEEAEREAAGRSGTLWPTGGIPTRGEHALLLFLGTYPLTAAVSHSETDDRDRVAYHNVFGIPLNPNRDRGGHADVPPAQRRLFVAWLATRTDPKTMGWGTNLAIYHKILEAAPTARTSAANAQLDAKARGFALLAVGQFGTPADVPLLQKAFTDMRVFHKTDYTGAEKKRPVVILVSDTAIAAALRLSGQHPADFGYTLLEIYKERGPETLVQYHLLGFFDDASREIAHTKAKKWWLYPESQRKLATALRGKHEETAAALKELAALLDAKDSSAADFDVMIDPLFSRAGWGGKARDNARLAEDLLVRIGKPAVPTLQYRLQSHDDHDRRVAAELLVRIGPLDASLAALLRPLLADRDNYVRRVVTESLGKVGAPAKDAIKDLEALAVSDASLFARVSARVALIRIAGVSDARVQALAAFMELKEEKVVPDQKGGKDASNQEAAQFAASELGRLGLEAAPAIRQLLAALKHTDAGVRGNAASSLGEVGASSPETVTALIDILKNDPSRGARRSAASTLGKIGPKAKAAIPALRAALKGDGEMGWWIAVDALGKIGGPEVVPALIEALTNPEDDVRFAAIKCLGNLGAIAQPAITALEKASKTDPIEMHRKAASQALQTIQRTLPKSGRDQGANRRDGDREPLPEGAIARLGTLTMRGCSAPMAYTPDGKYFVCRSEYPQSGIAFFDPITGKRAYGLDIWSTGTLLKFSPDGKCLACPIRSGNYHNPVWDVDGRKWLFNFEGNQAGFSAGGSRLITLSFLEKGHCRVLDSTTGVLLGEHALGAEIEWAEVLPGGTKIVFRDKNTRQGVIYDLKKKVRTVAFNCDAKENATVSRDGKLLALSAQSGVRILELATGKELCQWKQHSDGEAVFNANSTSLAWSGYDENHGIRYPWVVDVAGGTPRAVRFPMNGSSPLCFTPDGKALVVLDAGRVPEWRDIETGRAIRPLDAHSGTIWEIRLLPDGKHLLSRDHNRILVWDHIAGTLLRRYPDDLPKGENVLYRTSEIGFMITVQESSGTLRLRDLLSGHEILKLEGNHGFSPNGSVAIARDGKTAALVSQDGIVRVYELTTGRIRCKYVPDAAVWNVELSDNGRCMKWTVQRLVDDKRSEGPFYLDTHTGKNLADGTLFVAIGQNQGASLHHELYHAQSKAPLEKKDSDRRSEDDEWELVERATGRVLPHLKLKRGTVRFSADNRLVFVATMIGDIEAWEIASGQQRLNLKGHFPGEIPTLLFLPDGHSLVSGGSDTQILLWDLTGRTADGVWRTVRHAPEKQHALWAALADTDATNAHRAIWEFVADPDGSVTFLTANLTPSPASNAQLTLKRIEELNSPIFATRTRAKEQLAKQGESAHHLLQQSLKNASSVEQARRLQLLLDDLHRPDLTGGRLRAARAVEVLETIGTDAARDALTKLASGYAEARLTQEAQGALRRLQSKGLKQR